MSYHQHPPIARRRYSSVEETRHTALETIKSTWNEIDRLLQPLCEVVISLNAGNSTTLQPTAQIVKELQNDDTVGRLNGSFEKVIMSLAAAVARIQLRNSSDGDDWSIRSDTVDGSPPEVTSSQVILLEDEVLEYLISENLLLKTLGYATHPHCPSPAALILRWNLLRILETLVSSCLKDPRLLSHESILIPLLGLFDACTGNRHDATDQKMMAVMNELVYCLKQEPELVQFFIEEETRTTADPQSPAHDGIRDLRILSYLYPHIHNPAETGRLARSAVLGLLPILQHNEQLGAHVAGKSSFSAVLISGFCAFYHSLPRKLFAMFAPGWHKISSFDLTCSVDLEYFTEYMVFCNAAMQLSHPLMQSGIVKHFQRLFLTPVMGPALTQEAPEHLIESIAYLEYIARTLYDKTLRAAVLDHILLTEIHDRTILDHLIGHILHANSRVATMSIVLFDTLLSFSYKPLLDKLFLSYLAAARPFLQSDMFLSSDIRNSIILAETVLEFIPDCCQQLGFAIEQPVSQDSQSSAGMLKRFFGKKDSDKVHASDATPLVLPAYTDYLLSARYNLRFCWREVNHMDQSDEGTAVNDLAMQKTVALFPDLELHGVGVAGPFLASLLFRLDHMVEHDLYFCLQLTGLISRIMVFPYKEVWAFVFGQNYAPELAGRSLIQILGTLKLYVDSVISSSSLGKALVERVYRSLMPRRAGSPGSEAPMMSTPQPERRGLPNFLRNSPKMSETDYVDSIFTDTDTIMESVEMDGQGPRFSRRNSAAGGPDQLKFRMAAYMAVLLNEFLQELAAICHERAILTAVISCDLFDSS